MFKQKFILGVAMLATMLSGTVGSSFAIGHKNKRQATFKVRIENISAKDGIAAQDGSKYPFALSPGFYVVSDAEVDLFRDGKKASKGLEMQAEDGNPETLAEFISGMTFNGHSGVFTQPVGGSMASPIFSDGAYEFTVRATAGMKLNLSTMYGQSNDLFYSPKQAIDLFDASGNPLSGDITDKFLLWDAGTEVNQAPGLGADQAPRQKAPNTGADEKGTVHLVNDGFTYPATKDVLRITITVQ